MTVTLAQRRKRFALTSLTGIVLVGVILILLNVLANWVFFRFDLTHSRAYSLSASSRQLVRNLDDTVVVKAFFTPNLPAPYNVYERYVRDMLTEYKAASKGNVRFEFVLPYPPQDFEKRAQDAGLQPLQMEEQGADQLAIRRVYMGLVLYYRDKTEIIPVVRNVQQLEYDLTSKMARMATRTRKVVGYVTGVGEPDWLGQKSHVAQDLAVLYDLKPVNLMTNTTAPFMMDGLLVVGPARHLSDAMLWTVDQAIMRGIPTAFLVDAKTIQTSRFMSAPLDTGLTSFLQNYGFDLGNQLIFDAQAETIGISQNVGGFVIPMQMQYPFIPVISHIDPHHPVVRGIETLAAPFTVSVDPISHLAAGDVFTSLFETSARSWLLPPNAYNISPTQIPHPKPGDPHGPYSVAGVIEGPFTSYFKGKPVPIPGAVAVESVVRNSIVVIGTSHLIDPELPEFRGSNALISNLLAWVSKDDVLLGIRSKGEILRPLKPLTDSKRQMVKIAALLFPPFLAAGLGFWRWRRRLAWRRTLSAI
jgi:gliding-associated putative ABC transporter substrate-binding component GldG